MLKSVVDFPLENLILAENTQFRTSQLTRSGGTLAESANHIRRIQAPNATSNRNYEENIMDWIIIILLFFAGILWLIYVIRSNRNNYDTAIKSKDWQNNLRYSVNFYRTNSIIVAILMILFAVLLIYIKYDNR